MSSGRRAGLGQQRGVRRAGSSPGTSPGPGELRVRPLVRGSLMPRGRAVSRRPLPHHQRLSPPHTQVDPAQTDPSPRRPLLPEPAAPRSRCPGPTRGPGALLCPQHPLQPQGTPSLPRPDPRGWGRALRGAGVLAARNKAIFLSVPGCSGPVSALSRVRSQSWVRAALGQPLAPAPARSSSSPRPRLVLLAPHLAAGPLGGGKLLRSAASRGGPEPPGRSPTQPGQRQQRRADVWKPGTAGGAL